MPVDFGIDISYYPFDGISYFEPKEEKKALLTYRRAINALSPHFTTIWKDDHLQFRDEPLLEGWTVLTYMAAEFPQYKVGHLVLAQSYRNPALLAKMGATLQYLTGGRFIMGLGAGWHEEEYAAYGYEFPSPRLRVEQLAETILILQAMWTQSPATYHGRYYHIENAYCEPRPNPMIPILVGTNGKKALQVTARLANAWNWNAPLELLKPSHDILRQQCLNIGRDVSEISITCYATAKFPTDPTDFSPVGLAGVLRLGPTPADAITQLRPLIEFGVSHFIIRMSDFSTLEQFCAEVAPAVSQE